VKVPVEKFTRSGTFLVQAIEGCVQGNDHRRRQARSAELENRTGTEWEGDEKHDQCPRIQSEPGLSGTGSESWDSVWVVSVVASFMCKGKLPSAFREATRGTQPEIDVPLEEGPDRPAMACDKAQGSINCAEYRFCLRRRRSEPCCRSNAENVNQKRQEYPEKPKRTGFVAHGIRIGRFGPGSIASRLVHERRIVALAMIEKG
jgi:hypothetical protein